MIKELNLSKRKQEQLKCLKVISKFFILFHMSLISSF